MIRNLIVWGPVILALLCIALAVALRAQTAQPPAPGSEIVVFSEDASGCRYRIYGSDRGLEVVRSDMTCAVFISAWDRSL